MSIVDRIRTLSPAAQMGLAAATAVIIAAVLAATWLAMRPRYEVLFRDLRPADAATIVAQLDKDKIPYKLEAGGAVILAPASRIDQTRLAIMGAASCRRLAGGRNRRFARGWRGHNSEPARTSGSQRAGARSGA